MKNFNRLVGLATVVLLGTTACKTQKGVEAEVVGDCTGLYLRVDNKDYKICNEEAMEGFISGTTIEADFKKIKDCPAQDTLIRCELYHEYASWIEVTEID